MRSYNISPRKYGRTAHRSLEHTNTEANFPDNYDATIGRRKTSIANFSPQVNTRADASALRWRSLQFGAVVGGGGPCELTWFFFGAGVTHTLSLVRRHHQIPASKKP